MKSIFKLSIIQGMCTLLKNNANFIPQKFLWSTNYRRKTFFGPPNLDTFIPTS